ncbi:major pollen allergen Bet v 1-M/N-like [Alnus glutinosa]|uniref:major pollen allergen Bet v 1-M/N-like n=1 Tax=Alnus glutinosa TaxID=3517 RepID=UPI002D7767C0|nr:major pollen allergen Bet v 1-M/N-like [Alnus glutinosa]
MGVFKYEDEATSVIPPARLFKSFVLDADNLIPKVAPENVSSAENIEGNGGPGTIKKITFTEGSHFKHMKHKVEEIDHANFKYCYSVIEGGPLGNTLEKISYQIKIVPGHDGGSILKITSEYHTKGDCKLDEEEIKAGKEKAAGLFKAVEGYLLAHPNTYC